MVLYNLPDHILLYNVMDCSVFVSKDMFYATVYIAYGSSYTSLVKLITVINKYMKIWLNSNNYLSSTHYMFVMFSCEF